MIIDQSFSSDNIREQPESLLVKQRKPNIDSKLAILTWLHNGNYGTILQAYALQRYLRNEGYAVTNIDLFPTNVEKLKNFILAGNSWSLLKSKLRSLMKTLFQWEKFTSDKATLLISTQVFNKKNILFDKFISSEFCLTRCYKKFQDLKELDGKYDVYICGSDQIWSPKLFSPSYYFNFLKVERKTIAYACSFGVNFIIGHKAAKISNLLKNFNAISVREDTGVSIVKELIELDVSICVDPSFLLTRKQWFEIADKRSIENEYLLCFFLNFNKTRYNKLREIAYARKLQLVVLPYNNEDLNIDGCYIDGVGPQTWISLVAHAKFIATDSFHACVFSIIFRHPFIVFKRFSDNVSGSENSRLHTLLNTYELQKCIVNDNSIFDFPEITSEEFNNIEEKVICNSKKSKEWLIQSIQS